MASREREPSREPRSGSSDGDDYPLLFKGDAPSFRPGLLGRLLARILAFFREPEEARPAPVDEPAGLAARDGLAPEAGRPLDEEVPPEGDLPPQDDRPRDEAPPREDERPRDEVPPPEGEHPPEGVPPPEGGSAPAAGLPPEEAPTPEEGSAPGEAPPPEGESAAPSGKPGEPAEPPSRDTPLHRSTLQMLPGRLVPTGRSLVPQEIRFLRPSNPGQEVTLGWRRGEPPDHVTIDHPSIQMRHARMRYRRGHWWIQSLSGDHPVLLNGRAIGMEGGPRHLKDGDRVRLGDLEFHFRMP